MTKINEDLKPEAHKILKDYQHSNGIRNQGEALNAILLRFSELLEAENKKYWNPHGAEISPGIPYRDGDMIMTPNGLVTVRSGACSHPPEWEPGRAYLAGEEVGQPNAIDAEITCYRCRFPHTADNGNMPGRSDKYWYQLGDEE